MTIDKKSLIALLMRNEINFSEFTQKFNEAFGEIDLCKELMYARKIKDGELVDLLLYLGAEINFEYYCIETLNLLITDEWHQKHEDLVRLLAHYSSESSVNYLYEAALLKLDYRDYDEDFVLADKCIRALAKIKNRSAIDKLQLLCNVPNPIISNSAKKQLKKIST